MSSNDLLRVGVPPELLRLARERTGEYHAPIAHLVRAGLARLAGLTDDDLERFTPKRGRPRKPAEEIEETQTP